MTLKNTYLTILLAAMSLSAYGVPAKPGPIQTSAGDGSSLTILISGDEHNGMVATVDGIPLIWDGVAEEFRYADILSGKYIPTDIRAHDPAMRTDAEKDFIASLSHTLIGDYMASMRQESGITRKGIRKARNLRINNFPTFGSPKALVVLVEFPDLGFTGVEDPTGFYNRLFKERGFSWSNGADGSVADYFADNSCGRFTPEFTVVGPVCLSQPSYHYGADSGLRKDARIGEGLREACRLIDDEVDFSEFDNDGDGFVDNVIFCYAGYGQADSGISGSIWPHSYYLTKWGTSLEADDVTVDRYIVSNELCYYEDRDRKEPTGIGTFVHEFAHVLGLPDLYATDYSNAFHPGFWDLMAQGSYNNNSHTPPCLSAYERACLGWLDYTELAANDRENIVLKPLCESDMAYMVPVRGNDGEFFVLENRRLQGWDRFIPAEGMLIWHLDEDEDVWMGNGCNNDPSHQRIDIIEADGILSDATRDGDCFPGAADVTLCTLNAWDGSALLSLKGIGIADNGDVTFDVVSDGTLVSPPTALRCLKRSHDGFVFSFTPSPDADYHVYSIATSDGDPVSGYSDVEVRNAGESGIEVSGLEPECAYSVTLFAGIRNYRSECVTLDVTTDPLPFSMLGVENISVEVDGSDCTVRWDPVRDAQLYEIESYLLSEDTDLTDICCGFDSRGDDLPSGWTLNPESFYSVKGWYGEAKPSVRFSAPEHNLAFEIQEGNIEMLSLWAKARNEGQTIRISCDGTELSLPVATEGGIVSTDLPCVKAGQISNSGGEGFIVIDDVRLGLRKIIRTLEDTKITADTGIIFKLKPSSNYGIRIRAVHEGDFTPFSDEFKVSTGLSSVNELYTAPDDTEIWYDIYGRRVQIPGKGMYIKKKSGVSTKIIIN